MGRQLRCWDNRFVRDYLIAGTIIANANNGAILHRPTSKVAHALACTLAIEILSFEVRQHHANLLDGRNSRHSLTLIIHELSYIHCDVSAIALSPSLLPEIPCDLSNLIYHRLQSWTAFENTFHVNYIIRWVLFITFIF